MSLNTNTTQTTSLQATSLKTFYDRALLETMKPKLVHYEYAQKRPVPRHGGRIVDFRKWTPFAALTEPLTEGVVPEGQPLSMTNMTTTLESYGGYVAVSDMVDMTSIDPVVTDTVELMADQGALSVDTLIREELHKTTNVIYAGGGTSRSALTAENKLTLELIRKAVRTLKKARAPKFSREKREFYVAVVGPDTVYDLQDDPTWQAVAEYQDKEKIFSGEIGRIFGVVFVETTEAKIFAEAGAGGVSVASTLVFGRNAYGCVDLEGNQNVHTIVKPAGSGGSSDPLDQITTVGWKVDGFAVKLLQPTWLIRIEHGVSA